MKCQFLCTSPPPQTLYIHISSPASGLPHKKINDICRVISNVENGTCDLIYVFLHLAFHYTKQNIVGPPIVEIWNRLNEGIHQTNMAYRHNFVIVNMEYVRYKFEYPNEIAFCADLNAALWSNLKRHDEAILDRSLMIG